MHWSRPAAIRLLGILRAMGGSATTLELFEATGSLAVHSEVASLRCYLKEEMGIESPGAVRCEPEGTSPGGRRIYRYVLSAEAMFGPPPRQVKLFAER